MGRVYGISPEKYSGHGRSRRGTLSLGKNSLALTEHDSTSKAEIAVSVTLRILHIGLYHVFPQSMREYMMLLLCAWYLRQVSKPHWPAGLVLGIALGLLFVVVAPHQGTTAESHLRIMTYNVDGMSMNDQALLAV